MTIAETIRALRQFQSELPTLVGNEMINYALDNMRAESFDGDPWPPRRSNAPRNEGRRLLVDTGDGERSIRITRMTQDLVEISANVYMAAHNEGARISGSQNVRAHTRRTRSRAVEVRAHTRQVDFSLPKRTFLDSASPVLARRIESVLEQRLNALLS